MLCIEYIFFSHLVNNIASLLCWYHMPPFQSVLGSTNLLKKKKNFTSFLLFSPVHYCEKKRNRKKSCTQKKKYMCVCVCSCYVLVADIYTLYSLVFENKKNYETEDSKYC